MNKEAKAGNSAEEQVKNPVETAAEDASAQNAERETAAEEMGESGEASDTVDAAQETVMLTGDEFAQVKAHIEKLQAEKNETVALAQRLQADFDNYRRRNASIRADSLDEGMRELMKQLLPVLDNFDRALETTADVNAGWMEGVKLVQRQLMDVLKKNGLEEIAADGKFDPMMHEAVMQEEADGVEPETIIAVFQKGYKVKERIIRHSMVKVAK